MRWSRGFFRLWMVICGCYVGFLVAAEGIEKFKPSDPYAIYTVKLPRGTIRDFDTSKPREQLLRDIASAFVEDDGKDKLTLTSSSVRDSANSTLNWLLDQEYDRSHTVYRWWAAALVPPIGLLLLGLIIRWGHGFRPPRETAG